MVIYQKMQIKPWKKTVRVKCGFHVLSNYVIVIERRENGASLNAISIRNSECKTKYMN